MKLQTKIFLTLAPLFLVLFAAHSVFTYQAAYDDARTNLQREAHNIRAVLMATRRVYHRQFIKSGLPVDDTTVGFLPAHALGRISRDFPEWTDSGLVFNNVSDRARNPENAADERELAAMAFFRDNPEVKEQFLLVDDEDGGKFYHYTQPIWIEAYCLKCHGKQEDVPASIRTRYASSYGYELGDLRGVMSIKLPASMAHNQAWAAFMGSVLVNLCGYVGAFVLVYFLLLRTAVKRLKVLEHGAGEIAGGNYAWRSGITGRDEIASVAAGFDTMANRIGAREESLLNSERRFRDLIESAPDAMLIVDEQGTIIIANAQAGRVFGYENAELLGQSIEMLVSSRLGESHRRFRQEYHEAPTLRAMGGRRDLKGKRKDGSEFPIEVSLGPIETDEGTVVASTILDVTSRKQAEKDVIKERNLAQSYLDLAGEIIVAIDADEKITLINREGCELLGREESEIIGMNWFENFLPDSNLATVREVFTQLMQGETKRLERYDNEIKTAGGELRFITWHNSLLTDDTGKIVGTINAGIDITARKQAEKESRNYRDELAHVARISTMGEMATGIAHEISQPLAAITSYSLAAKKSVDESRTHPEKLHEILEKLETQAIRAGDIVRRLRDFARKSESARVLTDLNSLVREVTRFVETDMQRAAIVLNLDLAEPAPIVMVDEIQIQQVLVNLIRNGIDAMHETPSGQRKVTIATRRVADGKVEVTVNDVGKGLAADECDDVFNAFFSTKQEGMGMGLPISRSIVEAHNGKLWAKPNTGPGATFGFAIPTDDEVTGDLDENRG